MGLLLRFRAVEKQLKLQKRALRSLAFCKFEKILEFGFFFFIPFYKKKRDFLERIQGVPLSKHASC